MNKRVMYRLAFCTWMMILLACVYSSVFALAEEDSLSIYIDGEKLDPSVEPTIMNSRTFVPIRVIAEKWGATVGWNSKLQQVRITKDGTRMDLFIDRADAFVNKQTIYSDAPPVILEGRTMVPLRFVGELLGADIRYDAETRAVMVQLPEPEKPDPPEAGPVKPGELDPTLPTLQAIRFHDGQIVVEASEPVKPNVFYLTQPERIVIDVPGVNPRAQPGGSRV